MRKLEIEFRFCEGHPSGCPGSAYGLEFCRNFDSGVDSMGSNMVQYRHLTKVSSHLRSAEEDERMNLTRGRSAARWVRFNACLSAAGGGLCFFSPPPQTVIGKAHTGLLEGFLVDARELSRKEFC
jgi:hypothetical protein